MIVSLRPSLYLKRKKKVNPEDYLISIHFMKNKTKWKLPLKTILEEMVSYKCVKCVDLQDKD